MSLARYERHGEIAVITLDNPPVNALRYELRKSLFDVLSQAVADAEVKAIGLIGAGQCFSAGADINEFDSAAALREPTLRALVALVEGSNKPVVAALDGICMGGGLELAMGCHYRIATPRTRLALPEVKLGLLPGAGGTQRLPRLIGVEAAVNLIVSGNVVAAADLASTSLLDSLVDANLQDALISFAGSLLAGGRGPKRASAIVIDSPAADAFLDFARGTVAAKHLPASLRCIDAIEAASEKPFAEGLATEAAYFSELLHTDASKALRHAFFAERVAKNVPDVPADTPARRIDSAAVIGAGTMGAGITIALVSGNIPVHLLETEQGALDRGIASIRKVLEAAVKKGKMRPQDAEQRLSLVTPTLFYEDLAADGLVIEAVFEDFEVKKTVFERLDVAMKPGAILATNTSTLDIDRIARCTGRPSDVIGLHFFSPANVMRLLEIVRGPTTAPDVIATALAVARRIGKVGVVARSCDGFIGNRMVEQYIRQALMLIEEGALPQHVDRALEDFGMAMGPLRVADLAGNDIGWAIRKRRRIEQPGLYYPPIADRLCELGRFGQKTGLGWYRYEPHNRNALPDPEVERLIIETSRQQGITRRKISGAEIVDRCILALVNEGAHLLGEGIAIRASDIDLVYLMGYGFPTHRGGPMLHADLLGLPEVVRRMRTLAGTVANERAFWDPAPLLANRAAEGGTFN